MLCVLHYTWLMLDFTAEVLSENKQQSWVLHFHILERIQTDEQNVAAPLLHLLTSCSQHVINIQNWQQIRHGRQIHYGSNGHGRYLNMGMGRDTKWVKFCDITTRYSGKQILFIK